MKLYDTSFLLQEFVPPETYKKWGERSIWFIDERVVKFAQWLKDTTNSTVTINNWYFGGPRKYSGYRPPVNCLNPNDPTRKYAKESSHRRGIAIDVVVKGWTPEQVRTLIIQNYKDLRRIYGVTGYEEGTPTWTHIDFRPTGKDEINIIPYR